MSVSPESMSETDPRVLSQQALCKRAFDALPEGPDRKLVSEVQADLVQMAKPLSLTEGDYQVFMKAGITEAELDQVFGKAEPIADAAVKWGESESGGQPLQE
ncbi:hypothetical protein KBC79_02300 [Candidatus Woesebacteria bacterium]|nr:hypothetical protein [Candidatus Woesebacteria bacterium]